MDDLLVKRAKDGDKESYSQAVLQLKDQAYKVAYCYLHNEEDSMDAVCDAVEKAYKKIKNLRDCNHFNTWFIRIVINECKIQLRSKQNTVDIEEQMDLCAITTIKPEDKMDLEVLLWRLTPLDRLLIYMKYYLGYTLAEISHAMNMPEGTVKSKIYGTLKEMRTKLELREGV